jgi:hypothetical protein
VNVAGVCCYNFTSIWHWPFFLALTNVGTLFLIIRITLVLASSIIPHLRHYYGTQTSVDEWGIIGALPSSLQNEVVDFLIGDVCDMCEVFQCLEPAYLGRLLPHIRTIELEAGRTLIHAGSKY